jgi:plastocyanin
VDTTEVWEILNEHDERDGWHPFHLHVNDFDVLTTSDEGIGPRFYQDTIPLPPLATNAAGEAKPGSVKFCSRFVDYPGRFVYHCHFLFHEDRGMMAAVEVVKQVQIAGSGFPERISLIVGPKADGEENAGVTVLWTNNDATAEHTITAEEFDPYNGRRIFDSGALAQGCSFAHTFDAPGTIPYRCAIHPDERGEIVVEATQAIDIVTVAGEPRFVPADIDVALGAVMSWTNRDSSPHTITVMRRNDDGTLIPAADSPSLTMGTEFRQNFEEGKFEYWSTTHPGITGRFSISPVTRRSVSVAIRDRGFDPDVISVPAGSTVTWTNRGSTPQSIDPLAPTMFHESGPLNADLSCYGGRLVDFGQRFSHRFEGDASYFSKLAMTGKIEISADAPPGEVQIEIVDGSFEPAEVKVQPEVNVTWVNNSTSTHSVTRDRGGFEAFDAELAPAGTFFRSFRADDDGPYTVTYFSKWAMRGTIKVV